jgi:enoyl-CoA hydratase
MSRHMVSYDHIDYEVTEATARVALDRPEKLNALSSDLLEELEDALERAADADGVRVVVLSGNGRAFSAGYDIGEDEPDVGSVDERLRDRRTHLDTIFEHPLPIVAAVDGPALAGGCNLALAPDLTFATEGSTFGYPDMHFGEPPPQLVLPFVGNSLKYARELLYTGKTISAAEAERMGLVNRAVPDGELAATVEEEIDHIRKTPGTAVTIAKELVNDVQQSQGDRRGRIDELVASLTMEAEAAKRFREIRDEEGLDAALEWMHGTNKE